MKNIFNLKISSIPLFLFVTLLACSQKEEPIPQERIHLTAKIDGKEIKMRLGDLEIEEKWDGSETLNVSFAGGDIRNYYTLHFRVDSFTGPGKYSIQQSAIEIIYFSDDEEVVWISREGEIEVTTLRNSEFEATFNAVLVDAEGKVSQTKKLENGSVKIDENSR